MKHLMTEGIHGWFIRCVKVFSRHVDDCNGLLRTYESIYVKLVE